MRIGEKVVTWSIDNSSQTTINIFCILIYKFFKITPLFLPSFIFSKALFSNYLNDRINLIFAIYFIN